MYMTEKEKAEIAKTVFPEVIPKPEARTEDFIIRFAERKKIDKATAIAFLECYDQLLKETNDAKESLERAKEKFLKSSPTKEPVPPNNTNTNTQGKNDKISLIKEQKNSPAKEQQNETQNDENSPTKEPVPPTQHAETKPQVKSSPNKEQQKEEEKDSHAEKNETKNDENSPNKEENKSPNSPAKEKPRGTARQRAIQNLLSKKTEEALSVSITKEEKEEGDKTLKKVIDDLLTQWTLIDILSDHKQDIKLLRERGHSDATICQKFLDAYPKFGTIPTEYVEMALSRKSTRR